MVWVVRQEAVGGDIIVGVYSREDDALAVCEAGNALRGDYFWVSRINLDVFPTWFG